jgi:hypothetical protein
VKTSSGRRSSSRKLPPAILVLGTAVVAIQAPSCDFVFIVVIDFFPALAVHESCVPLFEGTTIKFISCRMDLPLS